MKMTIRKQLAGVFLGAMACAVLAGCAAPVAGGNETTEPAAAAQTAAMGRELETAENTAAPEAGAKEKSAKRKKPSAGVDAKGSDSSAAGQKGTDGTEQKRGDSAQAKKNTRPAAKKNDAAQGKAGSDAQGNNSRKQPGGSAAKSRKSAGKTDAAVAGASANALGDGDELTGGTYTATGDDESALTVSGGASASVTGARISKTGGSASGADAASFTGLNAAVRVYETGKLTLKDCTVEASAPNATGVFAYGDGVVELDGCTVTVTGGGAGGVQVAGGGTLYGRDLTVTSATKAAIRSDRGGGVMVLEGGTYTSTGKDGCPAIYSTADITVKDADCQATSSRAVIIEGKNSVTLENCTLTGNDQSTKANSVKANVLLYQSASGDAAVGTARFAMTGGKMTAQAGAMFYCTNTTAAISLKDAELELSKDGTLLIVSAGRWGKEGKNGGSCVLSAEDQTLTGTILVDSLSDLSLTLKNSAFTGAIQGEGAVNVTLDGSSVWTLTGDSSIASLSGDVSGLDLNGFTLYVNGTAYAA